MKKAIILLSADLQSSNDRFTEEARKISWVRNCDPRGFLGSKANGFYWDGEENQHYYDFTLEFLGLVNKYFYFEARFLKEKIEKFLSDDYETKKDRNGKEFDTSLLVIRGVSNELVNELESEYGAFRVHVSQKDLNTNIELYDTVLYEDDEDFGEEVNRVINVLTDNKQKEIV